MSKRRQYESSENRRVARKFLEEHSEYIKTKKPIHSRVTATGGCKKIYQHSPEAAQIAEFLGDNWTESG